MALFVWAKSRYNNFMNKNDFIRHACEQVLRLTRVDKWDNLREELKIQLGFNMGVMALGLNLSKDDGFIALSNVRLGLISIKEFREHIKSLILSNKIVVDEINVMRPF